MEEVKRGYFRPETSRNIGIEEVMYLECFKAGVPNTRAMDHRRSAPVRNRAAQQAVSGG